MVWMISEVKEAVNKIAWRAVDQHYVVHVGISKLRNFLSRRAGTNKPSPLIVNLGVNLCPIY
jgi:hypothetical protein